MQDLIKFFEKETNKKINIFKYNNEALNTNQSLVTFNNLTYVIEFIKDSSVSNINGYAYLFYQHDLDCTSLQDVLYNLYEDVEVISYNKYTLLISAKKLEINSSTPDIIETETYRNTYIIYLDKVENKHSLDFKTKIIDELFSIIIKDNSIGKYIDLHDLIIYKTIDLVNKDFSFSNLVNFDILNNMDDSLLYTGVNFIENGLNISKTSNSLFLHRNTLIYRLEKIKEMLNLDLKIFKEAFVFYLSVKSYFYLKNSNI
ncbi:PucR family transcriptional regulator [Romboutsia sp.]|uniref:PucR family transcriptional regulator n=1 Tax=Romboutsia sp. TaxID=1965302 RepID=UPI003F368116